MAELKTKKTKASPLAFVKTITDPERQRDARVLVRLFAEETGQKPTMWGTAIIGYGLYHYESERSRQQGDWPLAGFSPRKQYLALYLYAAGKHFPELLKQLGPHSTSVGCLYIKRLSETNLSVLRRLVRSAYREAKQKLT